MLTDEQIDEAAHELQRVIALCGGDPTESAYDYLRGILAKLPALAASSEVPTNAVLEALWESTHQGHPADFAADVLQRWGGWRPGVLGYGGEINRPSPEVLPAVVPVAQEVRCVRTLTDDEVFVVLTDALGFGALDADSRVTATSIANLAVRKFMQVNALTEGRCTTVPAVASAPSAVPSMEPSFIPFACESAAASAAPTSPLGKHDLEELQHAWDRLDKHGESAACRALMPILSKLEALVEVSDLLTPDQVDDLIARAWEAEKKTYPDRTPREAFWAGALWAEKASMRLGRWVPLAERMPAEVAAIDDASVTVTPNVLVTNNINARNRMGQMSHVWYAAPMTSATPGNGDFVAFTDGDRMIRNLTHWLEILPPHEYPCHAAAHSAPAH